MSEQQTAEHLFYGPIADEYHLLKKICPSAAEMSRQVAEFIDGWTSPYPYSRLNLLEIGCGTGMTTTHLLALRHPCDIVGIDNAPAMLSQARQNLAAAVNKRRLELVENDALSHLHGLPDGSIDIVASAYTLHNFLNGYRRRVLEQILRVLKPGGLFINGDRYAVDDTEQHLRNTQEEIRGYFRVFLEMNRPDLLEHWIVHLFSDESKDHIMRLQLALDAMAGIGFRDIGVHFREGVNALVSGVRSWP